MLVTFFTVILYIWVRHFHLFFEHINFYVGLAVALVSGMVISSILGALAPYHYNVAPDFKRKLIPFDGRKFFDSRLQNERVIVIFECEPTGRVDIDESPFRDFIFDEISPDSDIEPYLEIRPAHFSKRWMKWFYFQMAPRKYNFYLYAEDIKRFESPRSSTYEEIQAS